MTPSHESSRLLDRLFSSDTPASPLLALDGVKVPSVILQDFQPLTKALEWELSELHWSGAGITPFVENDVPYLINNSGLLSEHLAAVLFAQCAASNPSGPVALLELGAGTGLFARYFLEAFAKICAQENADYVDRLTYHVTDRSGKTIAQWQELGIFSGFEQQVIMATCDATRPGHLTRSDGREIQLGQLDGVICNYILDVLPATILRSGSDGAEELRIRTHLSDDKNLLAQYTSLPAQELVSLSKAADPAARAGLIPFISLFEFETRFEKTDVPAMLAAEALQASPDGERIVLNHGAVACLDGSLALLKDKGFIAINDYGPIRRDDVDGHALSQRFGPTSALGLNFPFLEQHYAARGHLVLKPEGDDQRGLHSRLLMTSAQAETEAAFHNRFGPGAVDFFEAPVEDARKHIAAGRKGEALDAYRIALSRSPKAWQLVGEIAEFVGLQLQDLKAARELIGSALQQNPWYSPWLWNVLGDILFLDGDVPSAHEAYLCAQKIHASDARTNLNLAYTWFEFGKYDLALQSLAAALASDVRGILRPRILEKQHQILGALSGRWLGEQERLARRAERLLKS